jgi:hypothetical protein
VIGDEKLPFDLPLLLILLFWFYVQAISLTLGATAIVHEREQVRWDQLRLTAISKRELVAGFLWGRLGPVWASALTTSVVWWLLLPGDAPLLAPFTETQTSRSGLAIGGLMGLGASLLVGEIGLLASVRFKSTAAAVAMAALFGVPVGLLGALCLLAPFIAVWQFFSNNGRDEISQELFCLFVFPWLFYALFVVVREAIEARLEE